MSRFVPPPQPLPRIACFAYVTGLKMYHRVHSCTLKYTKVYRSVYMCSLPVYTSVQPIFRVLFFRGSFCGIFPLNRYTLHTSLHISPYTRNLHPHPHPHPKPRTIHRLYWNVDLDRKRAVSVSAHEAAYYTLYAHPTPYTLHRNLPAPQAPYIPYTESRS